MTNLKKLRAFSFHLAILFLFAACSSKPVTEMYTLTEQAQKTEDKISPFIILKDQSLVNSSSLHYLKIAKEKNPEFKSFIILTKPLDSEFLFALIKNINFIDGFILHYPIELKLITPFEKPIINTSILDLQDDQEFYAEKETLRFFRYNLNNKIYVLSSPAPFKLFSEHEEPYRFYFEDAIISTLRLRKELKKISEFETIIISDEDVTKLIQDATHPYLVFSNPTLKNPEFFLVGKNKVQFCQWFYKATKDCFEANDEDAELLNARKKLLEDNNEKIEAFFYNEKIEASSTN